MRVEDINLSKTSEKLEQTFEQIYQQRMLDIPICNHDISVKVVGFQSWDNCFLGVLVTPWFMNLILLPQSRDAWENLKELESVPHIFPSGRYSFLVGYEAELGKYQSCSLFSPMFEFADNDAAIETATEVIKELMNQEHIDQTTLHEKEIQAIWQSDEREIQQDIYENEESSSSESVQPLSDKDKLHNELKITNPKGLDRRALLTGRFKANVANTND